MGKPPSQASDYLSLLEPLSLECGKTTIKLEDEHTSQRERKLVSSVFETSGKSTNTDGANQFHELQTTLIQCTHAPILFI